MKTELEKEDIETIKKSLQKLNIIDNTGLAWRERLQEQLKEANEVILLANSVVDAYDEIDKYLEKWGVK